MTSPMSPSVAADTDRVNGGHLKPYQDEIRAAEKTLARSMAENLPPGTVRMSLDEQIMPQIDVVATALGTLIGAFRAISLTDGDSVDRLGRVLTNTDEVSTHLAGQFNPDGTSNRT